MELVYCILYIAALGIAAHFLGNALPRRWFDETRFPYRSFSWEQEGQIYRKIRIQSWKDRLPDMSKICRDMVRKEVKSRPTADSTKRLIQESCVAELVHFLLIFASVPVMVIWKGAWGKLVFVLCILGNLPFLLIQRYNRPRLCKLYRRLSKQN